MNDRTESTPSWASPARGGGWLFVLPWELHEPGGVSQVVQGLMDAAPRVLGMRAMLLVKSWQTHAEDWESDAAGRPTLRMAVRNPFDPARPLRSVAVYVATLPRQLWRLRRLVRRDSITHVSVHYPALDAVVWPLVGLVVRSLRVTLSFHGTDLTQADASRGLQRRLWGSLLRAADDVICCSEQLRAELQRAFPGARARVAGNGVDPERLHRLGRGDTSEPLPPRFVLGLATFERKKGLDVLLRAFATIADTSPGIELVLAGRVSEPICCQSLRELGATLECRDRIRFLPNLSHEYAMAVLARASLLVLPSRKEPFGIVVLESAVLGVPFVLTSVCGVAPLLLDVEAAAAVVAPDDVDALAGAIGRALAHPEDALAAVARVRDRVLTELTWERLVRLHAAEVQR